MNNETLICLLCGKNGINSLSHHISKKHHISVQEYIDQTGYTGLFCTDKVKKTKVESSRLSNTFDVRKSKSEKAKKMWDENREHMIGKLELNREARIANLKRGWQEYQYRKPKSPDKMLREALFERAQSKCEMCGKSEKELLETNNRRLCLHHKHYGKTVPDLQDVLLLCSVCHASVHKIAQTDRYDKVCRAIGELLRVLDVDIMSSDFRETPRRMASYFMENVLSNNDVEFQLEEYASSVFDNNYGGMVLLKDTDIISMCPHHLLPVFYKVSIAYIPNGNLAIGLSKLHRIAETLAKKPMMQENYTSELVIYFQKLLDTEDVAVRIKGNHSCMTVRGVKVPGSEVITTELRGSFMNDPSTREEFYFLLNS